MSNPNCSTARCRSRRAARWNESLSAVGSCPACCWSRWYEHASHVAALGMFQRVHAGQAHSTIAAAVAAAVTASLAAARVCARLLPFWQILLGTVQQGHTGRSPPSSSISVKSITSAVPPSFPISSPTRLFDLLPISAGAASSMDTRLPWVARWHQRSSSARRRAARRAASRGGSRLQVPAPLPPSRCPPDFPIIFCVDMRASAAFTARIFPSALLTGLCRSPSALVPRPPKVPRPSTPAMSRVASKSSRSSSMSL
mmetsp:Transcript_814/g.2605  ORF Transcript_814/g.2605 Transcript_814/m.2605 type:complete len:256 (-) Transcript_814:452-1219(-)